MLSKKHSENIGKKFGPLLVIGYTRNGEPVKKGNLRMIIKCDCGREKQIIPNRLKELSEYGSCGHGCLLKDPKRHYPGKRVNQYVLVEKQGSKWLCKCDCGKKFLRRSANINHFMSCGCFRYSEMDKVAENKVGLKFGLNKIISHEGLENGERVFIVKCKCGYTRKVYGKDLTSLGYSCGCQRAKDYAGENNHWSKLREFEIRSLRQMHKSGYFGKDELCEIFGITKPYLDKIISVRVWKHAV